MVGSWVRESDTELERVPLKALRLKLPATPLQSRVERLYAELDARGIRFRPHVWFSTDWFSPDSVPGIAVPFYLGHPRLARLERRRHGTCEGWGESECMRLLRHEAGHAIDTAFGLARKKAWRETFGRRNAPYRKHYRANPFDTAFVRHLPRWYAQSHPAEDFAETFAVWLAKGASAARAGSGARFKLEQVGSMMATIAHKRPRGVLRERPYSLASSADTIGDHYARKKRERTREPAPPMRSWLDGYTFREERRGSNEVAAHLRRKGPAVRKLLVRDGIERYDVDQMLQNLRDTARMEGRVWKSKRKPDEAAVAKGVRAAWNRLRRGATKLPR